MARRSPKSRISDSTTSLPREVPVNTFIRWFPINAKRVLSLLLLGMLGGVFYACSDATGPGTANIKIQLTDAPADAIASAEVSISGAFLLECPEVDAESEACEAEWRPVELEGGATLTFDLMDLQNGVIADLTGFETVEATVYHQLRLVVENATVILKEGYTLEDTGEDEVPLKVPSGYTSGIKVQLDGPIDLHTADFTTILVDFDVEQNFVLQGLNPETKVLKGVIFTPTLKEKERSQQSN